MDLETKKKKLELARVSLAKEEIELKICEKEEEINRLREAIRKQDSRIQELTEELENR